MIKLKELLHEIALPPSDPKDAMGYLSQLIQTIEQSPLFTDPAKAQKGMSLGIRGLAGLSKSLMLSAIVRHKPTYIEAMRLIKSTQEKLSTLYIHWAQKFDKERNEDNQRNATEFHRFLNETYSLLGRSTSQFMNYVADENPESKGAYLIGVKQDIERLNEMYAKMIFMIDDLFKSSSKEKISTDIRTITPNNK